MKNAVANYLNSHDNSKVDKLENELSSNFQSDALCHKETIFSIIESKSENKVGNQCSVYSYVSYKGTVFNKRTGWQTFQKE